MHFIIITLTKELVAAVVDIIQGASMYDVRARFTGLLTYNEARRNRMKKKRITQVTYHPFLN